LLKDAKKMSDMSENISKFARSNAAEDIVNEIDKVLGIN